MDQIFNHEFQLDSIKCRKTSVDVQKHLYGTFFYTFTQFLQSLKSQSDWYMLVDSSWLKVLTRTPKVTALNQS